MGGRIYKYKTSLVNVRYITIPKHTIVGITSNSDVRSNILSSNDSGDFFVSDTFIAAVWLLPLLLSSLVIVIATAAAATADDDNSLPKNNVRFAVLPPRVHKKIVQKKILFLYHTFFLYYMRKY